MRNRSESSRGSWLRRALGRVDRAVGTVEGNLKAVYGGAQVDPEGMGTQPERAPERLTGVAGRYEVRRDSAGHTYLVRAEGTGDAPQTPQRSAGPSAPRCRMSP